MNIIELEDGKIVTKKVTADDILRLCGLDAPVPMIVPGVAGPAEGNASRVYQP